MKPEGAFTRRAHVRGFTLPAMTLVSCLLAAGCVRNPSTTQAPTPTSGVHAPSPLMTGAPVGEKKLAWQGFDDSTFVRAKAEQRFVVLDGAAEWCHYCHVMEETTYADPRVRALLGKHFIATKVDVDARPDIEERYGDWGWPATVIFTPDGQELGKYRGYIPPDDFLRILESVVAGGVNAKSTADEKPRAVAKTPLSSDALELLTESTELELEEYWDPKEGGWGREPKVPIGVNALFALSRAARGEARYRERALTVLDKQRKLIDPVWGGIYQYSVAPDWDHPHYEKLMYWNAGALASYAEAFALTRDPKHRASALDIRRWLDAFMISPEGGFYATQDADCNAHAPSVPHAPTSPRGQGRYVKGEDYYKLPDAERRRLGIPRIDPNEYADDNGLAVYAYATFARAMNDDSALATAKRAAARILGTHKTKSGGLLHVASFEGKRLHLSDAAVFGFGLTKLAEVSGEARWRDEAAELGRFLERELYDREGGAFFSEPLDENAVGVFRVRRKPFEDNVTALRFLIALDRLEKAPKRRAIIEHSLRSIATPQQIKDRGKFLGDFLSLLDEIREHRKL